MVDTQRRKLLASLLKAAALAWAVFLRPKAGAARETGHKGGFSMNLPPPRTEGPISLEKAIARRRTVRAFGPRPLRLEELSQLLWSAQGITDGRFKRSAPSAGALFPIDLYAVTGEGCVEGLPAGVYHYQPQGHRITAVESGDLRQTLARAGLSQMWMAQAPLQLVITAEYSRISGKYGARGERYAHIEAGHISQNIFLQAEALGLKAGIVGAFDDAQVVKILKIPATHVPILIMPVGHDRE
jgi:SagB-type dehydrogenase family enzyme